MILEKNLTLCDTLFWEKILIKNKHFVSHLFVRFEKKGNEYAKNSKMEYHISKLGMTKQTKHKNEYFKLETQTTFWNTLIMSKYKAIY